jgi:hypothetical protein
MHYFYLFLLSFLVVSCQQNKPSEMAQYHVAKVTDLQKLEQEFDATIAQNIDKLNNSPLSSQHFPISEIALKELKETMKTLKVEEKEQANAKKTTAKDKKYISNPTPSTSIQELENLDSITNTNTTPLANKENKINNGALLLNVRNYQDAYNRIGKLATKYDFNISSEEENTTNFRKGNTMEIYAAPEDFDKLVKEFRSLAVIIRKKQIWQQKDNYDFLRIQSQISTSREAISNLNHHLANTINTEDILRIQEELTNTTKKLDLMVLSAKTTISNKAYSAITLSFYQELDLAKPAPEAFSADFSSNLLVGWTNFKQFLLDAALVWPYIILALIFLSTAMLAVGSSRRKARQFKLQMLHGQNLQQQIAQLNSTTSTNNHNN